jgi:hypothetical protein
MRALATELSAMRVLPKHRPLSRAAREAGFWILSVALFVLAQMAAAAPVSVAWDPVNSPELAGYKIHYGYSSKNYSKSIDVGKTTSAVLSGLNEVKAYYLAVSAYSASGDQSKHSNEVVYDLSKIDTDNDGLSNWDEISVYGTDPYNADTDGDGLADGVEVNKYRTDPKRADTDGDGIPDGAEVTAGSNPLDPKSVPLSPLVLLPQSALKVVSVNSEELTGENGDADNAVDGKTSTIWHTQWYKSSPKHPHQIVIKLSQSHTVAGLRYLPRQDSSYNGTVAKYTIYVSTDGVNWGSAVSTGTFAKDKKEKEVVFANAKVGQYVRFVAQSEVNGNPWTSAAELKILTK